ncbi:MAG: DUF805 domain-containing protein [Bacteroides sp.]|nr:DUF805 domain-containing protein [Bacteroides sp.]
METKMMGPVEAVKVCFAKYFDFSGRASRAEFWWWILFTYILTWVIGLFGPSGLDLSAQLQGVQDPQEMMMILTGYMSDHSFYYSFYSLVQVALFIPSLAVQSRRLHDIGCSAWWMLLYLTCIGFIPLIIMAIIPGQRYDNQYGSVPGATAPDQTDQY